MFGEPLEPAEVRVLRLMAEEGLTVKQVAEKTKWSESEVKDLSKSLKRKLGARSMAQAVAIALEQGVLT